MARAGRIAFEDVEGLRVGRFELGINTTVIVYRIGNTVIDTGMPHAWKEVRGFLEERPVGQVLLTHHHEDHGGNGAAITASFGAPVYAHREALAPLAGGFGLGPYQRVLFGRPTPLNARALPMEIRLEGGGRFVPVHAPGHAADLVCYLEPDRGYLFTGDLFVGSRPRYLRRDENLSLMMESLRRVQGLDFQTMFCAHRGVVKNGRQAIRDKLDYLEGLCLQARQMRRQGFSEARITRSLLGREDLTSLATLFHFTKRNLIRECLRQ